MNKKKLISLLVAIVIAIATILMLPKDMLGIQGRITMGCFLAAIVLWVMDVFPFVITCFILMLTLVVTKAAAFGTAFSGMTQTTWWLMLGAMGFSVALSKTGVLKRISYHVLRMFPPTFNGQILAVAVIGLIISPMIPSVNVKIAMLMPMVKTISDTIGYGKRSKGAHGLWATAYASLVLTSLSFATANLFSIIVSGILPENGRLGWFQWFLAAIPWTIICVGGTLLVTAMMFKPAAGESKEMSKAFIDEELAKMGPMSRNEKITLGILVGAVLFWIFESQIGIASQVTALIAMILVVVLGIIDVGELQKGVPWNMLLMVGVMFGIGGVFTETGINEFITALFTPLVNSISGNTVVFLVAFSLLFSVVRMIVTNVITLFMVFIPLFIPFAAKMGINPWIIGFIALVSQTHWGMLYMSNFGIPAFGMWGGEENLDYNQLAKPSWVYCVLNIIAIIVSIPFWKMIGLIG